MRQHFILSILFSFVIYSTLVSAENPIISQVSFTFSGWNLLDAADSNFVNNSQEKLEERYTNLFIDIRTKKKYRTALNIKIPYSLVRVKKREINDPGLESELPIESVHGFSDIVVSLIYFLPGVKLNYFIGMPTNYSTSRNAPWLGAGTYTMGTKIEFNFYKAVGKIGIGSGIEYQYSRHINNSRVKKGNNENSLKLYFAAMYKQFNMGIAGGYNLKTTNYNQYMSEESYGKLVLEEGYSLGIFAGKKINEFVEFFGGYNGGFGLKNAPKSWSYWMQLKYKFTNI